MNMSQMLQFYFQLKICILQGAVQNNILYKYHIILHVILVNIFIMSYVSKNEYFVPGIFIFHFCLMNLRLNHKFTALVFESVNCGLQLLSCGTIYIVTQLSYMFKQNKTSNVHII